MGMSGQIRVSHGNPGQVRACQGTSGQVRASQSISGQVKAYKGKSGQELYILCAAHETERLFSLVSVGNAIRGTSANYKFFISIYF